MYALHFPTKSIREFLLDTRFEVFLSIFFILYKLLNKVIQNKPFTVKSETIVIFTENTPVFTRVRYL